MRDWSDVLPKHIAEQQHAYDRWWTAKRMSESGFTYREIAERFGGISIQAARVIASKYNNKMAPIERHFSSPLFNKTEEMNLKRIRLRGRRRAQGLRNIETR